MNCPSISKTLAVMVRYSSNLWVGAPYNIKALHILKMKRCLCRMSAMWTVILAAACSLLAFSLLEFPTAFFGFGLFLEKEGRFVELLDFLFKKEGISSVNWEASTKERFFL
ncbi:hypothetical protein WICPIJ_004112 [Wickerhamomyces pijperi]|uniref:Uncharacterized protein n=1 Tax=Wickerhamomyces pijperi TaxID=599730 RepID=A0A9P8Q8B6_WICPI|nr:hypothetical protein WICPIJ_004112 [Wickerhamomyces pijperi]